MLNINIVNGKTLATLVTRFTNEELITGETSDYFTFIASQVAAYRDTGDTNCLNLVLSAGRMRRASQLTTQIVKEFSSHKFGANGTTLVGKSVKKLASNIAVTDEEIVERITKLVERSENKAAKSNAKRKATIAAKQEKVIEEAVTEAVEAVEEVALPAAPELQVAATPEEHYAKIAAHIQALLDMGESVESVEQTVALSIVSQAQAKAA